MKTTKYLLLLIMLSFSLVFAQFEDEIPGMEEEEETEVVCIPENMTVGWDSMANKEISESDVRQGYSFGYEYYKNKSYKEAMPYMWQTFLHGDTKFKKNAMRKIAAMYYYQGMVDSTLIASYRGLEVVPNDVTLHHYASILEYKLGRYECAIPHYEALVESDPNNVDYVKNLGICYFNIEDERCIAAQEKVVALQPDKAEEADLLAEYSRVFLDLDKQLAYRKDAYEKDPENLSSALAYAKILKEAGNYSESLKPFSKVLAKEPTAKVYILRAESYEYLNQNNNAISDYKEVLKLEPENVSVMLRIAENYKMNNAFSSAKYWINKTYSIKRNYGDAHIAMGELYEAAVAYCTSKDGGKINFEDKLVYELAAKEYEKAKNDKNVARKARTKLQNLQPFLPTKEDRFMNQGKKIKSSCYTSWI